MTLLFRGFIAISSFLSVFYLAPIVNAETPALGAGVETIDYELESPFAIGDTVSMGDMSSPKQRCIKYDDTAVLKNDTEGAVASSLRMYLVRNYEELEKNLTGSLSVHASAKAGIGKLAHAGSSFTGFGKFEDFVKTQQTSLLLVLEVAAQHGRQYIGEYELKPEFVDLANAADKSQFISKCGTHFVRGRTRKSSINIVIEFSELSKSSKNLLEANYNTKADAGVTIKAMTLEAKNEITANISNIVRLASKFARTSVRVDAAGGGGVESLVKLVSGLDLSGEGNVAKLLEEIAKLGDKFTPANSAPDRFILVPYPQLIATDLSADMSRFDKIGQIYKYLLRVDQQIGYYEEYKSQDYDLWNRYLRVFHDQLMVTRGVLYAAYVSCRQAGKCDTPLPEIVDGLLLQDVLVNGQLTAECPMAYTRVETINKNTTKSTAVISSIVIGWNGEMRFSENIDLQASELFRLTPDFRLEPISYIYGDQIRQTDHDLGHKYLDVTLYRHKIDKTKIVSANAIDYAFLTSERKDAARSIYIISFFTKNGIKLEEVLGYPDMSKCELISQRQN